MARLDRSRRCRRPARLPGSGGHGDGADVAACADRAAHECRRYALREAIPRPGRVAGSARVPHGGGASRRGLRRAGGGPRRPARRRGPPRHARRRGRRVDRGRRGRAAGREACAAPRPRCRGRAPSRGGLRARRPRPAEPPRRRRTVPLPRQRPHAPQRRARLSGRPAEPGAARPLRRARRDGDRPGPRAGRLCGGAGSLPARAPAACALGGREDDRTPVRDRSHPERDRRARGLPGAHAERWPIRHGSGRGSGVMRRAVVTLGHPDHAGMLRSLKILDDAAGAHGWELKFVLAGPHPLVAKEGLPAARIAYLPALRRWRSVAARLALPAALLRLARLARGADVLYACTLSSFPYCLLAGRLAGVPAVVHVYSSYPTARPYRKHLLGRARHLIAPSADSLALARDALGGFAPGTRARVVYNGMDLARIAREADAPAGVVPGVPGRRLGMVGNLDARKNPALLVEALAAVRRDVPDAHALLIGAFRDPGYEARVGERIAALGLGNAVTVTGFLANPFPLVRALDLVVHPATRDPFPLALLEAMALERPIVATAVGGIPEMLEDGVSGVLVPPGDAGALAAAAVPLLRDPERRARIGRAARERLATRFSLEAFAAGMFAAFEEARAA